MEVLTVEEAVDDRLHLPLALFVGPRDLLGEDRMMERPDAVGRDGRVHAFVHKMGRRRALRIVELVPRRSSRSEDLHAFIGKDEHARANAVPEGILGGSGLAGLGSRPRAFLGVLLVDLLTLFGRDGHRRGAFSRMPVSEPAQYGLFVMHYRERGRMC